MFQVIVRLIAVVIMLLGVISIYDSRIIIKRFFGFGDQNEGAAGLKILGFVGFVVGAAVLYFVR